MDEWLKAEILSPILLLIVINGLAWYKSWINQQNSQNDFGRRVGVTEQEIVRVTTELTQTSRSCENNSIEQVSMRERIASNSTSIRDLKDEFQTERLAVMSKLHENDRNAAGRDAVILERLSRLEERFDVSKIFSQFINRKDG
jgi:hypothetical protein